MTADAVHAAFAGVVEQLADALAPQVAEALAERLALPVSEPWRLADVDAVAAMLGRSRRWVHGAVKDRGLPVVHLDGGALCFDPDDVREWALARRVPALPDAAEWLQGGCTGARSRSTSGVADGRRMRDQKVRP